jgi:hypothetical protein
MRYQTLSDTSCGTREILVEAAHAVDILFPDGKEEFDVTSLAH